MFWRKKRKKTVKKIEGGLWDYMVKYMAEQGVRLSILQSLRMVECNVLVGDKPVGLTIFRIFHPAAVKNEGVTINEYQSLDSHPELILYEGYYETTDGRATNIKIEKSKERNQIRWIRMITVTERAKEQLKTMLIASKVDPDDGLRLLPSPGGRFVLAIGSELSGDQVVEYEGHKVLLVGIEYFNMLDGAMMDYRDTKDGPVLLVKMSVDS